MSGQALFYAAAKGAVGIASPDDRGDVLLELGPPRLGRWSSKPGGESLPEHLENAGHLLAATDGRRAAIIDLVVLRQDRARGMDQVQLIPAGRV